MFFFFLLRPGFGGTGAGWMRRRASSALTDGLVFPTPDGGFSFSFFFFCCAQEIPASQAPFNRTRIHWQHEAPRSLSHEPPTAPLKKDPGNNSMINVGKTAK